VTKSKRNDKNIRGKPCAARGKLITFEGIEGSGKSTHARMVAQAMRAAGHEVIEVREPGGTRLGEAIRLLLSRKGGAEKMCAPSELLLFMASRAQLVEEVIRPKLAEGWTVLCDRWIDATLAYQGAAGGVASPEVKVVNWPTALTEPLLARSMEPTV